MTIDDLLTPTEQQQPRARRSVTQVGVVVASLMAGIAGVGGLVILLAGSFQGTFFDVSTCGYAGVGSTCQNDLRERVRDTFHIPLGDDVRVEQFRKYGFPDPTYEARLVFPTAQDAVEHDLHATQPRADGTVLVTITRSE
ncbi:hypothetical protein [Plantibacter sp. CFBP 8804]|uniref:hypothetical protein n=1 Tax=Plantibacter sp. CFBP 8804 TaxID=2775270 RepID=UPI00177C06CA|nr:hypothetical protein [Plantibacter sp. CFBP 8804]MBD8518625.1 hypothetical protein [Plantibacter sp. CFBP 8804]